MIKLSTFLLVIAIGCGSAPDKGTVILTIPHGSETIKTIDEILVPAGFSRIKAEQGSFAEWLRNLPLKKDKTVYLYNGSLKPNQSAQYAVLDISVGARDLQQCADVVMRLRAEYLFSQKRYTEIAFMDYAGKWYRWTGGGNRIAFDKYLQTVFSWCGSASLEKQLKPVKEYSNIKSGDVLVKGGFPGHVMIVVDVAKNSEGEKIYMLVQGYQPAQDMHVVVNPVDGKLSPWYELRELKDIITPEWQFEKKNLRSWD